jgi:hypothetical protein
MPQSWARSLSILRSSQSGDECRDPADAADDERTYAHAGCCCGNRLAGSFQINNQLESGGLLHRHRRTFVPFPVRSGIVGKDRT